MSTIKSLWASVQGDPVFMRRVNGWLTVFWIAMIPVSIAFGLLSSVAYVSALSLWALVSGHWSAWQAARVEVQQQADAKALEDNPIEERVVDTIIRETEVNPAVSPSSTRTSNDPAAGCATCGQSPAHTPARDSLTSTDALRSQLSRISEQIVALQRQIDHQPS